VPVEMTIWMTNMEASRIVTGMDNPPAGPMPPAGWPEWLFHGFLEAAPDAVVIVDGGGRATAPRTAPSYSRRKRHPVRGGGRLRA